MMMHKAHAKVNIFLKIAGKRDNYHELVSRFVRVQNLFDTVSFVDGNFSTFTLEGEFGCELEKNTIYKAYLKLLQIDPKIENFFKTKKVVVEKNIPEFAGLGGGSSDCASFMILVNKYCNLDLSKDELSNIGSSIGADVPFFIYEYNSANVTGIGEIVKPFEEELLNLEIITPKIMCDTGKIFTNFRNLYYNEVSKEDSQKLLNMKSIDILNSFTLEQLNDLYLPALHDQNDLKDFAKNGWFFSGSGSSFFKLIEENNGK